MQCLETSHRRRVATFGDNATVANSTASQVARRRRNTTSQEAMALHYASGTIIAPKPAAGKRRCSRGKEPPTTPSTFMNERAQATLEELGQETPKPSDPIYAPMRPVPPGMNIAVRLPPRVYNGPTQSGGSSTIAASTHSDGFFVPDWPDL